MIETDEPTCTIDVAASAAGLEPHVLKYGLRSRGIAPVGRDGKSNLYRQSEMLAVIQELRGSRIERLATIDDIARWAKCDVARVEYFVQSLRVVPAFVSCGGAALYRQSQVSFICDEISTIAPTPARIESELAALAAHRQTGERHVARHAQPSAALTQLLRGGPVPAAEETHNESVR